MLIPEQGLGITILTTGDHLPAMDSLTDIMLTVTIPEIEKIQRERTKAKYTDHYKASDLNSSMTLEVFESRGVAITEWISNGTDFLEVFKSLVTGSIVGTYDGPLRIFPTGVKTGENGEVWMASFKSKKKRTYVNDDFCLQDVETETYGSHSISEVVVYKHEYEVTGLHLRALRVDKREELKSEKSEKSYVETAKSQVVLQDQPTKQLLSFIPGSTGVLATVFS